MKSAKSSIVLRVNTRALRSPISPRALTVLLALTTLLSACAGGGGGSSSADSPPVEAERRPTTGVVYPAVSGLEFVELDAAGEILQRSTPTSSAGTFAFPRPLSGVRIVAREGGDRLRVAAVHSARVHDLPESVTVTPLTTISDHLLASGVQPAEIESAMAELLQERCKFGAGIALGYVLTSNAPVQTATHAAVLHALEAYLAALRRVGLGIDVHGSAMGTKMQQHRALLHRMCAVSEAILAETWASAAATWMANHLGLSVVGNLQPIEVRKSFVLRQVLDLQASEMVVLEYPQLPALTGSPGPAWVGREIEVAYALTLADIVGVASKQAAWITDTAVLRTSYRRGTSYRLDRTGVPVETRRAAVARPSDTEPWPSISVRNLGVTSKTISIDVNGSNLEDFANVVAELIAYPRAEVDEPLHRRAWRYVHAASGHAWPVSAGLFLHRPELYLRSVGLGLCDDRASVLQWIWVGLGYNARVWGLEGHVVPEVAVGNHWEMYDPDYGVYYLNRNGGVAGVTELQDDISLITNPVVRLPTAEQLAYHPFWEDIYGTKDDNFPVEWYSTPFFEAPPARFVLPPNATLDLHADAAYPVATIGTSGETTHYAAIRLSVPQGFVGTLPLPYVVGNLRGDATVTLNGVTVDLSSVDAAALIADHYRSAPYVGLPTIDVQRVGPDGLTIEMMANPLAFDRGERLFVEAVAPDLSGVELFTPVAGTVRLAARD